MSVKKLKTYSDIELDRQIRELCSFTARVEISTSAPPAASEAYRGVTWITMAAAGVADTAKVCLKSAANTYSWVTVATG